MTSCGGLVTRLVAFATARGAPVANRRAGYQPAPPRVPEIPPKVVRRSRYIAKRSVSPDWRSGEGYIGEISVGDIDIYSSHNGHQWSAEPAAAAIALHLDDDFAETVARQEKLARK